MKISDITGGLAAWTILSLTLSPPVWVVVLSLYTMLLGAWIANRLYGRLRSDRPRNRPRQA